VLFIRYYEGDKTRDDGMGRVRSTYGRCDKCIQNFGWRKMKGGGNIGDIIKVLFVHHLMH